MIGVPEGEEREKGPEKIFEEIIAQNFPNVGKEKASQVREALRAPYRIHPRKNTPRRILIKLTKIKDKEKNIKSNKGKQYITSKGVSIRLSANFSAEILQTRKEWQVYLK